MPEICSNLEETDARIIFYIKYIEETMPHITTVRVRAKDSDIYFILLSFTTDVVMDTGDRLLSVKDIAENYDENHLSALLALHAFTGSDCTSAFKGKGKVRPIKLVNAN